MVIRIFPEGVLYALKLFIESVLRISLAVLFCFAAVLAGGCSSGKPAPVQQPELASIDGVKMTARTAGRFFEVYTGGQWQKFTIKGVNIGTALPGRWFTEFPSDKRIYQEWFSQIAAMNANTIRVYTLLDPVFYEALADFNLRPGGPRLWLLQEIWPDEEVPGGNLYDPGYLDGYRREIVTGIDALHGRVSVPERRGRAWGSYTADVSPYLLGVLIGRELLPEEVRGTNEANRGRGDYGGRYVRAVGADPAEVWLAEMCDFAAAHSQQKYGWQAPVAFVSWPTLDPLIHPTEFTPGSVKGKEYNDSETVNPVHLAPGPDSKAGFFAAYHIYPNYPDFIYREPEYENYKDEQGVFRYGGYLHRFISVHPPYPALVAEFGMSTSLNTAHLHPEGLHHGGVSEKQQGEMIARMMRAIMREGYCGGVIFQWADEWAKKTWTTEPFMIPYDRHVLWHNAMDPEQNYGILACEPYHRPFGGTESLLWRAWDAQKAAPALPGGNSAPAAAGQQAGAGGRIAALYADADAAYLYLAVEFEGNDASALLPGSTGGFELLLGIDTFGRKNGSSRLPPEGLPVLPGGAEFLLKIGGPEGSLLLARPDYSRGNARFSSAPGEDGQFLPVRILVNRRQVAQDGAVFPERYSDESRLHYGVFDLSDSRYDSLSHWYTDKSGQRVYIRLPWLLLNVSDPSSHRVLRDNREGLKAEGRDTFSVEKTEGIMFFAATTRGGVLLDYQPSGGGKFLSREVNPYLWKGWDKPAYRTRLKQSYAAVAELFAGIK